MFVQAIRQHASGGSTDVLAVGTRCVQLMCRNRDEAAAVVRSGALSAVLDGVMANPEADADQVGTIIGRTITQAGILTFTSVKPALRAACCIALACTACTARLYALRWSCLRALWNSAAKRW